MITNSYEVVDDDFEVVEEFGPFVLGFGEAFTAINLSEMGEIESIELVTDNPYASLYLELDDFRPYSKGVTASELINRGKDKPTNKNLYAEDRTENGEYVIKYSPINTHRYTSKIKIEVRNDITPPKDFMFQPNFEYRSKNNLPNPSTLSFAAGGFRNLSKDGAAIPTEDFSQLKEATATQSPHPLGFFSYDHVTGVEDYSMNLTNDLFRKDPLKKVGYLHPYVGRASQVLHQSLADQLVNNEPPTGGTTMVVQFAEPGTLPDKDGAGNDLASLTGYDNLMTDAQRQRPWPGNPVSGEFSRQAIFLYAGANKDITDNFPSSPLRAQRSVIGLLKGLEETGKGCTIYARNGDTIYYPGRIVQWGYYVDNGGGAPYPKIVGSVGEIFNELGGVGYTGGNGNSSNKGVVLIVEPGLNFAPKEIIIGERPSAILTGGNTPDKDDVSNTDFGIVGGATSASGEPAGAFQTAEDLASDGTEGISTGLIVKKLTVKRRRKVSVI